jgi:alginate O-acetyltransferase complex protein AlgI
MSFASLVFFLFLPVVFCVHWLVPHRKWQNSVLLVASYIFYGWWDWRFCFLMIGSSLLDYWAGILLDGESAQRRRKTILIAALSANLVILGFFKYYNFFSDSLTTALGMAGVPISAWTLKIILPVGISFYTFQTMSYTLDIYLRRFEPMRNVVDYLTFVSFFPQLVAGPIERATNLLPQFYKARSFSLEEAREGCRFILWGLAKKLVVADNLAPIVNSAFSAHESVSGAALFLGTICFAFQIYCDFSAYSDMAVGSAKLFGIQLMRNFAYPYFSQSLTEFWRRWHISLSTWFRDYIYIPLGGNRVSPAKHYRNLFIVALVSGLWHGAAWHFVIWGVLHGLFLVGERALGIAGEPSSSASRREPRQLAKVLRILRTFALVCLAWIFFRVDTVPQGFRVVTKIATGLVQPSFYPELLSLVELSVGLPILVAFVLIEWLNKNSWNTMALAEKPLLVRWSAYTLLFWFILLFGTEQTQTFIYFAF